MIFWIYMLITVLIIPLTMILFGKMFMNKPPRRINNIFGYRTKRSMMNEDTWEFAHKCIGKLWFRCGLILLPISVLAMLSMLNQSADMTGTLGGILTFLQMIPMIGSVIATEYALKNTFDEYGNRL